MTYGFIGTGNMGGALARALVREVSPLDVYLNNRTPAKAEALAAELGARADTAAHIAAACDYIFLGVKPNLIAGVLAQLAPTAFGEGNRLFTEFKGALTENFVLQTLITQFEVMPRYWSQNNPPYEVDFLIQRENDIFPVEVKSETNTTSKSMKKFKELFPDKVKLRVRFSLDNLKLDNDVLNIPLFMADQADRLIGLALEKLKNS